MYEIRDRIVDGLNATKLALKNVIEKFYYWFFYQNFKLQKKKKKFFFYFGKLKGFLPGGGVSLLRAS